MKIAALGKVSAVLASIAAVAGVAVSLFQLISSRNQSNRIAAYEHHQKALQLIYAPHGSGALHVGSIYALSSLASEIPSLGFSIANELAVTALDYSKYPDAASPNKASAPSLSSESEAALRVIGELTIMKSGLPLQLAHGYFRNASLPNGEFNGVQFWGSDLSGADFYASSLYGADLRFSRLDGASLPEAILTNAGFYGATLCPGYNTVVAAQNTGIAVGVSLSGAKLDHATFQNAWLVGARFDSDPGKAPEQRTYLFHTSFSGADLEGANFQYANVSFADFSGADLTDANFTNASGIDTVKVDRTTRLCRTIGLKIPGAGDQCGPTRKALDISKQCVLYKTWRELDH